MRPLMLFEYIKTYYQNIYHGSLIISEALRAGYKDYDVVVMLNTEPQTRAQRRASNYE